LGRSLAADLTLKGSREGVLLEELCHAYENLDGDAFTQSLGKYDKILPLDRWETSLLLRIKKAIEATGDEDSICTKNCTRKYLQHRSRPHRNHQRFAIPYLALISAATQKTEGLGESTLSSSLPSSIALLGSPLSSPRLTCHGEYGC
jgi:hypothetical protein